MIDSEIVNVKHGFPVPTHQLKRQTATSNEIAYKHIHNLSMIGKTSGQAFFMNDVLNGTYKEVKQLRERL